MNKQEAIEEIKEIGVHEVNLFGVPVLASPTETVIGIVKKIDEPKKPVVPQVAVEFYEKYKNDSLSFDEWFGDFYTDQFLEDFPRGEELCKWLYDNPNNVNSQRELALATLIVNGPDAVEVEKEKRYTVEIPNPNETQALFHLFRNENGKIAIADFRFPSMEYRNKWKEDEECQLTESEIKQDYYWLWEVKGAVEEVKNEP